MNNYIADIKRRRKAENNILEKIEDGAIAHNIYKRILSHWELPSSSINQILNIHYDLAFLDESLKKSLHRKGIELPNQEGLEEFELEFMTACKIPMIVASDLPPLKKALKTQHERMIKKIKPALKILQHQFHNIDPVIENYIAEIIQQKVNMSKHGAANSAPESLYARYKIMTDFLISGIDQNPDHYFKSFKGGHKTTQNRQSAISAMAESYHLCFGVMPMSSENSPFRSYCEVFVEWLKSNASNEDDVIDIDDSMLAKDVKKAIKNLKSKINGLEKQSKITPLFILFKSLHSLTSRHSLKSSAIGFATIAEHF